MKDYKTTKPYGVPYALSTGGLYLLCMMSRMRSSFSSMLATRDWMADWSFLMSSTSSPTVSSVAWLFFS